MKGKKYFDVKDLLSQFPDTRYFFILGGRSTGKTYSVTKESIDDAIDGKGMFAYVRRYKDSITQTQLQDLMSVHNKHIYDKTEGLYNRIIYYRGRWYLENWDYQENKRISRSAEPIGLAAAINTWETSKGPDVGAAYGGIKNIIFDETLSKGGQYLRDEFSLFQNVVSSLVRDRTEGDTKIFMLANPVSRWSTEYFDNLGITQSMLDKPGTTLIKYPNRKMTTVFCYMTNEILQNDSSVYDTYFAFPNSKLKSKSITDGIWELDESSRLPSKTYQFSTNIKTVYIYFAQKTYACDIMRYDETGLYYLFYRPAKEIKDKQYYLINEPTFDKYAIVCSKRRTTHPLWDALNRVAATGQIYYSSNAVADAIRGFYASLPQM